MASSAARRNRVRATRRRANAVHDVWLWVNRLVVPVALVLILSGIHLFL